MLQVIINIIAQIQIEWVDAYQTRATRRRMSYKWRQICRNSLDTASNFDIQNVD